MARSSRGVLAATALAACCALGACAGARSGPGELTTAQIRLDEDGSEAPAALADTGRRPSLTSPVAQICAYPGGKQVLDKDLPGLTTRPEYVFFSHMSLKTLQGMSRGQLKDDDLRRVDADLRALP